MRARASVVTVLAATLLVGGCSGGDEPEAEPTPILPSSSSAEPSPSESEAAEETAPEMPEEAREATKRGADAFVRHWAAALTFALNTGDTDEVDALAEPGCDSCDGTAQTIQDIYSEGGRIESDGWTVKQLGFGTDASNPVVRIDQGRERVWTAGERKPEVNPAAEITLQFFLVRESNGWSIENYEFVA